MSTHPSEAQGDTDVPLLHETIAENLRRTATRFPRRDAVVACHQEVRLSYADLNRRVDELARALLAEGLGVGDRLGIWSPNNLEWILVQYATARIGVILVNINPAYRTSELEYALRQSGCRWLIAAPSFKTSDYADMIDKVRPHLPELERTVLLGSAEWTELMEKAGDISGDQLKAREDLLRPEDPINIQYTSGTTGYPKGATLTHSNILNNGYFVARRCAYTEEDRVCVPVPFYHCFGMVMGNLGCTTHGAAIVIPGDAFDPVDVLKAIEAERCTSLYGVPTMFIATLGHPEFSRYELSSLRTGIMAGSPCPVEVMKEVVNRMHMEHVTICYGMTETSPVSTQTEVTDQLDRRVSTVGRVHPHVQIKVTDPESGDTVSRGAPGEFCTRGYSVMRGYWDDPERSAQAVDENGWMHTGDLAVMDDDGYVNIVGRIKDMVIRGGENIYPREVEEYLYSHPDILDVQVIGVPDPTYGEELMAWIKRRDGSSLSEQDVRDYCNGRVAHFKTPRYVKFVDTFPMTVTGKIQKFRMREAAIDELDLTDVTTA